MLVPINFPNLQFILEDFVAIRYLALCAFLIFMHLTHSTMCIMLQISLEWAYWNFHMNLMFTFFCDLPCHGRHSKHIIGVARRFKKPTRIGGM